MIYILGAGAMGRETLSIYKSIGKFSEVGGFIEDNSKRVGSEIDGKIIMDSSIINTLPKNSMFIGAIGSPLRKRLIKEVEQKNFKFDTVIHPSVVMDESVKISSGCIICPGVILTCDIKVGQHTIINIGSTISHDCKIGNFVTICPGVNIGGRVTIEDSCFIGIGAKIINRITIGENSFIGAGAVVTEDIPKNTLALGVPAKPIKNITKADWRKLI